jgi:hypothetical protein
VFERSIKVAQEYDNNITQKSLFIPKIYHQDSIVAAIPKKTYANGKLNGRTFYSSTFL